MASLSDDLLKKTIDSMLLKDITSCLRKVGVTISAGDNKPRLAARLFTAVRMGLPAIDTQEEEDRRVMQQKAKKTRAHRLWNRPEATPPNAHT